MQGKVKLRWALALHLLLLGAGAFVAARAWAAAAPHLRGAPPGEALLAWLVAGAFIVARAGSDVVESLRRLAARSVDREEWTAWPDGGEIPRPFVAAIAAVQLIMERGRDPAAAFLVAGFRAESAPHLAEGDPERQAYRATPSYRASTRVDGGTPRVSSILTLDREEAGRILGEGAASLAPYRAEVALPAGPASFYLRPVAP